MKCAVANCKRTREPGWGVCYACILRLVAGAFGPAPCGREDDPSQHEKAA